LIDKRDSILIAYYQSRTSSYWMSSKLMFVGVLKLHYRCFYRIRSSFFDYSCSQEKWCIMVCRRCIN